MIRLLSSSSSSSSRLSSYPRAAVAITVQFPQSPPRYLLIRRANPPDQGKWSLPGGKIHWGERTLDAAQRELGEETNLIPDHCHWSQEPFTTTDAIVTSTPTSSSFTTNNNKNVPNDDVVAFHYLIAHCFARLKVPATVGLQQLPKLTACDDALDAQWYTLTEIQTMESNNTISTHVSQVIQRAEALSEKGVLI